MFLPENNLDLSKTHCRIAAFQLPQGELERSGRSPEEDQVGVDVK